MLYAFDNATYSRDQMIAAIAAAIAAATFSSAAISVQNIQLDKTVGDGEGGLQFLNALGGKAAGYKWNTAASARLLKDKDGIYLVVPASWTGALIETVPAPNPRDKPTYRLTSEVLNPGEAAQVWTQTAGKTITVFCPYELK